MAPSLVWFLAGTLFLFGELAMPGFVLFFFGIGAWTAAAFAWFHHEFWVELLISIFFSLLTLILFRRMLTRIFSGMSKKHTTEQPHYLADKIGKVTKTITPGNIGEIDVGGSFWRAVSSSALEAGAAVKVVGPLPDEELILNVNPSEQASNDNQEKTA